MTTENMIVLVFITDFLFQFPLLFCSFNQLLPSKMQFYFEFFSQLSFYLFVSHGQTFTGTETVSVSEGLLQAGEALTDEAEARLGQVRPFKDGVEDVLSFTVQLVHLVQNKQPEEVKTVGVRFTHDTH